MIGCLLEPKRADSQSENGQGWRTHQSDDTQDWTIGKDVQAYLPNRLVVLLFHGVVLSDKVKSYPASCMARVRMVGAGELSASELL